jgi:uncharacterized protein
MRSSVARVLLASSGLCLALCMVRCAQGMEKITLTVGGQAFTVEVARTDAERQKGLMERSSLGAREGMLFVFDRDEHLDFWMKNTRIPLSIAFLASDGRILEVADMQPFSMKTVRSRFSSRYALELRQGTFAEIGAGEGAAVAFPEGFR